MNGPTQLVSSSCSTQPDFRPSAWQIVNLPGQTFVPVTGKTKAVLQDALLVIYQYHATPLYFPKSLLVPKLGFTIFQIHLNRKVDPWP